MMAIEDDPMETAEQRARAWLHENADAIAAEVALITRDGIPGAHLAVNYPRRQQDRPST